MPAVGLVATRNNGDSIIRSTLRAIRNGHQVLVIESREVDAEIIELVQQIGGIVLTDETERPDEESLHSSLVETAKAYGFPGLIYHEDTDLHIEFEESTELVHQSDRYAIPAKAHSSRSSPDESFVLAAVPAYNEAETIDGVVRDVTSHVDEVVVVDDGSDDGTGERAEEAGAEVVVHEKNAGYGAALKSAFLEAEKRGADHLVILDGDGQHDPSDIDRMVERQVETGAEIVVGSRFVDERRSRVPSYRRLGLAVVNVLTNLSTGTFRYGAWIRDTQSGFRVYDRAVIESLANDRSIGDRMNASTDIIFHARRYGYDVEEVGTTISYDVENASTLNPLAHGFSLINNILVRIERDRPVTVLGIPGLFSILVGLGFGYWTLTNYLQTETFPLGLALVATLFILVGLFACFTSIILHSLNTWLESSSFDRPRGH